jgi:cytidylate kinase
MQRGYIAAEYFDKESLIVYLQSANSDNTELGFAEMYLNDTNVEKEIRTIEVSSFVSKVATITEVKRKWNNKRKWEMMELSWMVGYRNRCFPKCELKIFMTASATIRAKGVTMN